ncbi:outer membrane receptor for ferrienterochelin and colicins [Lishizhenia tianjinensis]|uniref:Outer membrane receptor for ferrienterochelin and colicins n=1 Tax=Lishizhenia tianjinensis TaxID=477690 RepID=A0A1I6YLT5_9FLAO|nr:TonB-dependent receptor [Lishizhenia tianjinensis]SFT51377.1 outer membrane receptor for ferrienterochelin and colicins [Lishizhenia tianjinensis]
MRILFYILLTINSLPFLAQELQLVNEKEAPLAYAKVYFHQKDTLCIADAHGSIDMQFIEQTPTKLTIRHAEIKDTTLLLTPPYSQLTLSIPRKQLLQDFDEVVVSATLSKLSKKNSPVNVEVYSSEYFEANPTPSLFESMQNVNGVRPQLNCNVCNTGDIHINGLEGPYTMILIDGMPIVSGLSTVYGLSGIPQSMIERIEIIKGPASTLYGSEAVGGLINVITKDPSLTKGIVINNMLTSWGENNLDFSSAYKIGAKTKALLGFNFFNYSFPIDNNHDNFTDVTLSNRLSLFNTFNHITPKNKAHSLAFRVVHENRWGGEMNWTPEFRGTDSIYGESILTNRWEIFSKHQLDKAKHLNLQFSANGHYQDSYYGTTSFNAQQHVVFGQLTYNKTLGQNHKLLSGVAMRYTHYDDNTPATEALQNLHTLLPGVFLQDQIQIDAQNNLLIGIRYDYNSKHGNIISPRLNYKWNSKKTNTILRLGLGNGYRVANVFTEDHAALTGARTVEFVEALSPETSYNANINLDQTIVKFDKVLLTLDASLFYTYFTNRIIADYESDPDKIIYDNLDGFAVSQGASMNAQAHFTNGINLRLGFNLQDVSFTENGQRKTQILTEKISGTWSVSFPINPLHLSIDYTGNLYGPMRLPLVSDLDSRDEFSPYWSLQNIKINFNYFKRVELYAGVKNLLNFTPPANSIARAFDPFDKEVSFDADGNALATPNNPEALTFDPSYVYAPNQGIRVFIGVKWNIK